MAQPTTKAEENLPVLHSGGKVAAIVPTNFNEVVQIAGAIVRADMAPASYKGSTEKATVAIMAGMEVGLTPFAALQSIAVINGTPAVFGDGLVALVRASGLLEDMQEGLDVGKDGQPMLAWCKVKRRGEASWKERELNWVECVKAGWTRKQGPWTLTPGRMMTIRVRGWLFRDVFADVLKGLKSAEEVQDMVDITGQGTASVAPAEPKRTDYADKPQQQDQPASPPGGDGQPGEKAAAAPTATPGQPASTEKPAADAPANKADLDEAPKVTDVVDQNEQPAPLEFQEYTRVGDFFAFSDPWLQDAGRTPAEAKQWEAFYRDYIAEKSNSKSDAVRAGISETIGFYSAVLAKEQPA